MAIPQDQLAQAFAQWSEANPNATDADISQAMQQAGVNPLELSLALGIDPNAAINRYNQAIQQNPLSNPLTSNQSSTGNPLLSAGANTVATSLFNPEALTSTIGERAIPGALGGIMNFAAADDASGRKNAALNTLISVIGGPAGTLFKAFLDQFGFFKGGGPKAVNLTPEQEVEQAYKLFQNQPSQGFAEGEDARLTGMIMDAEKLGLDTTEMRNQLKTQFGIDSVPGDLPEGYVRDSQGFLRDVATEGYWLLGSNGSPIKTTPPLVNVPMPNTSSAGGGGAGTPTASTTGSSTGSPSGSSAAVGEWVYDSGAGLFRQVGGIETIKPTTGDYKDGQVLSSTEMQGKFGEWGQNTTQNPQETPTQWADIFQRDGAKGVLDLMKILNKTSEDVAKESGVAIGDIEKAIGNYNAQVAGTGTTGTGTTGTDTTGTTGTDTTGTDTTGTTGTGTTDTTGTDTTDTTGTGPGPGPGGKDGKDGRDGKSGLLTSLVNSTPIASQLFKPELFEAENKVSGLFDLVMRTRA